MLRKRLSFIGIPLILLACALLGGFYGRDVQAATDPALSADLHTFANALTVLEQNAAEKPTGDKAIYDGAIPGMLRTLDPHSNFFDPKNYKLLLEDQQGHYSGVGMQVGPRNEKTVVLNPFPGSPAYRAGIRPGDIIAFVNDKPTANLNTTEVADMLKGPRNTPVKIAVSREGSPDYITFNIVREDIIRHTVNGFWVKPDIAYIRILSFGDNTARELDDTLRSLGEDKLQGLVLDLRGNPGGLLNQAVAVADHFLQKGQAVVSQHGRASAERVYRADRGNHGREYPIVVLVNQYSASAAEIVSGAMQDHDRAWILGETTFGKGLVQTVFPMRDNTGLALTTAHFYTPSGRLIQRDYTNKSFFDYYYHKDHATNNPNDVKMTDSGRTVYGGGGITPDEKFTPAELDSLEVQLYRKGLFNFTRSYFASHPEHLPQGWMPDTATLTQFHDYLRANGYTFTDAAFTNDTEWIKRYLAKEMYIWAFNVDDSDKVFEATDPEVAQAVQAMPKALTLLENARKVIVQRMK
ncbi:MAG TPA: S41 family peptidase [Candidatus Sulfopaludibacter sp.]|jgi:carboxyl-terminal processing protease|nr:S41 family peptidase [Candidatus Sulfopaludibacter sp.]